VLGGATNLLSNECQEALQWRMREPNLGAKLFLGGVGVQKTGEEIATALNNMDVSSEYVLKLRHEIDDLCAEVSVVLPFYFFVYAAGDTCLTIKHYT
jgi:conserved oligomeric Golgi complex subunit 4